MGTEPRAAWRFQDGVAEDWTAARGWHGSRTTEDPLSDLERIITEFDAVNVPELGAFWGGAIGYFGYDVVRAIEHLPSPPPRGVQSPDALFVLTRAVVIIDNLRAQARMVIGVPVTRGTTTGALRQAYDDAQRELDDIERRLRAPLPLPPLRLDPTAPAAVGESTYERSQFLADVERIREYIFAGDCFQALLSRRIRVPHDFPSDALYRALRALNPSPYMYHLVLDGVELVGSSPELLVRGSAAGTVTLRPIAGTRRRGRSAADDEAMTAELIADEKERAEHLMLVDLGRNDVGRVARYGTVSVTELMGIEKYSHVLHI
jgi:anthranilate synthase component 1